MGSRLASLHLPQLPSTGRERRKGSDGPGTSRRKWQVLGTGAWALGTSESQQCPSQQAGSNKQQCPEGAPSPGPTNRTQKCLPPSLCWSRPIIFFRIVWVSAWPSWAWCSSVQALSTVWSPKPKTISSQISSLWSYSGQPLPNTSSVYKSDWLSPPLYFLTSHSALISPETAAMLWLVCLFTCVFTGRTVAETEAPILWPLYVKSWLTGKDPDAGKD